MRCNFLTYLVPWCNFYTTPPHLYSIDGIRSENCRVFVTALGASRELVVEAAPSRESAPLLFYFFRIMFLNRQVSVDFLHGVSPYDSCIDVESVGVTV